MPWDEHPFLVIERINDNAYEDNLPRDLGVSTTFNVIDLILFLDNDHLVNLTANSI